MCLIVLGVAARADLPLILAANRDEFYRRPTAAADFWDICPAVLAGRDLQAGGTWMGVTRAGRWAAVTNVRNPQDIQPGRHSRGRLVRAYLCGAADPGAFLHALAPHAARFPGFNLLLGAGREVWYFSNRGAGPPRRLAPGVYGLSNALLDTPWPKVRDARADLSALLQKREPPSSAALFALLADRRRPPDAELPDTGVGLAWERVLGSRFIESADYGTRCATLLRLDAHGGLDFRERTFEEGTLAFERGFNWHLA
ncbi:NRDE family protein [Geoalkalibacter halelectricus]|uniref:NRDE family protein n=1 Tax=Geoalkalibacter halelectricus TaxID=2847045 RepID=A0ABY5ZMA2_9BACT|nr:NRDE family protein [Geoalkalibacter halelectricus]MDO3378383.1 NRDE family protein [Geoalkalibacter halelectricus]UWZ80297.1 NRDE family protein [Geoalkalibacter halelectricus]